MTYQIETTSKIDSAFASHLHRGAGGVNGDVVVRLRTGQEDTGALAPGTIFKSNLEGPMAGKTLADSIDAGYMNVHTKAHPAGEISCSRSREVKTQGERG